MKYEERTYRNLISKDNLKTFNITIAESDLFISSDVNLAAEAKKSLLHHRTLLENYIKKHSQFLTSLLPLPEDNLAPAIVRDMLINSNICGVGPMAAVAGAIAQFVGNELSDLAEILIIEHVGVISFQHRDNVICSV